MGKYYKVFVQDGNTTQHIYVNPGFYSYLSNLGLNLSESIQKDHFDVYVADYKKATGKNFFKK